MTEYKDKNSYNTELTDTFAKMSISHRHYQLVGSSQLLKTQYVTDYDLNSLFQEDTKDADKVYDKIYDFFVHLFQEFKKNPNTYITDFKTGSMAGVPHRWTLDLLLKMKSRFIKTLKQKAMIKLDCVYVLNGLFTEVSMVYAIRVGQYANFKETDFDKDNLVKELKKDIISYSKEGNYLKVLKRKYSLFKATETKLPLQEKLLNFFNSPVGILYKAVADLKTYILMKEQTFRKVPKEDFYKCQQIIKQNLNTFNLPTIFKILDKPKLTIKQVESIIKKLTTLINKECLKEFGFLLNGSQ
jgi:hypothetical protein